MDTKTLKKVLIYLKKYIWLIVFSLLFAAISVATTLTVPILIGQAIDCIVDFNKVDFNKLKIILIAILILVVVTGLVEWIMNVINNKIVNNVTKQLRDEAFMKIQSLPLKYLDAHPSGVIVSKIIQDVDQFSEGLLMSFTQLFTGILTIIGTLVLMFVINWIIALVVLIVTPISLFVAKFIATKTYEMFKLQSETKGEQTGYIFEMINNLKVVQAYNHEEESLKQFDEINERLKVCSLKATFYSSLPNPLTRFVNGIVYAGVALSGGLLAINPISIVPLITVGSISTLLSFANQYTKPFNEISSVITELQNSLACASRVIELIEEPVEDLNKEANTRISNVKGYVKIDNISFSYDPRKKLIEHFSIDVMPGQKVALVGPTGCGKTTFINLLMRFYELNEGNIFIDGVNIKNITTENLRKTYGMVLQDTWLKNATVFDNVALSKPGASMEEVKQACILSHADSFIQRLSNGYETVINDEGDLSQGQKQLLCIARIMLCKPSILILDEATSSIDTRTEIKIQEAFNKLMENKTSFIVAHRLSTIQNADIILVMNEGKIIEKGSHEQLLKEQGFYYNLYNSQFSK